MDFPSNKFLWKGSCLCWFLFVSGVSLCRSSGSSGSYEVAPAVDTSLGRIIGSNVKIKGVLVHQFLGVPYAKVPTGLWDILAGLQWVNDHIGAFGGDVSRITVAGTSAGSIATGLLAVSPLAQGLFTRQIMMSGSPAYTMADNNDQSSGKSQEVAELVKCSNDTFTLKDNPEDVVRCLRGVDAMELIQAESSLIPHSSRSFLPKYGDEILPNNPRQEIMGRNFRNKENVFIGNIKDEGSFQITTSNPDLFGFFGEKNPQINKTLGKSMLRKIFKAFADTEALVGHYLPDSILEDDYDIVRSQMYSATGDYTLICPTVFTAEKFSENGNKVYFYLWSHRPSTTPWAPWMGTSHYSEAQFLFGLPIKDPKRYEDNEVRLSMDIIHKWSNFVKHGKPMEQWPLYSKENPIFLTLNTKSEESGMGPHKQNCDFFRPYFGF